MRSFLRISGERKKNLFNNNSVNFTDGAFKYFDLNAARTPSFVPESPSVTTPAEQSLKFTSDSFAKAVSFDTTGALKPMTGGDINNSWFGSGAEFPGYTLPADMPNAYVMAEKENKTAELKAQEEVKEQQKANASKEQEFFAMLIKFLQGFSQFGSKGAIASTAGASTGNATTPTATTTPPPVAIPTVVAA